MTRSSSVSGSAECVVLNFELPIGVLELGGASLNLGDAAGVRAAKSTRCDVISDDGLEAVELLGARVEVVFEGLVFPPEILLDTLDLVLEAANHGLDGLDGGDEVLAEPGEHGGNGLEAGECPAIDEAVIVGPVGPAQGGQTGPQNEKEIVALRELVLEVVLEL